MQINCNFNSKSPSTGYLAVLYLYLHLCIFLFAILVAFTWYAVHIFIAHVILTPCKPPAQQPPQCKINCTHSNRRGDRVERGGRWTTFVLYCTHKALALAGALAALQWTQLNGKQIWFICCFFCISPVPPFPLIDAAAPPPITLFTGKRCVRRWGLCIRRLQQSNEGNVWLTHISMVTPPSPYTSSPLYHSLSPFPPLSPDDIRFRIHIHIH